MIRAAAGLALACLTSGTAAADIVPGIGRLDSDYYSRDPNPVRVDFTHRGTQRKLAELVIPRRYIVWTNLDRSSRDGPLPDVIAPDGIKIAFTGPDGEAWNETVARHAAEGRVPLETAATQLRPRQYTADLHGVATSNRRAAHHASIAASFERQPHPHEGMIHFKSATGDIYVGDESDSFESANCSAHLNPGYFCTYTIGITDAVVAHVKFLDFRLHGGRAYANERARFVYEVVCRFTDGCATARTPQGGFVGDRKRTVCIRRDMPQKEIAIGYSRHLRPNLKAYETRPEWFDEVKGLFWRLRVPALHSTKSAPDRPDVAIEMRATVLPPSMVAAEPIDTDLRWQLGAAVSVAGNGRPAAGDWQPGRYPAERARTHQQAVRLAAEAAGLHQRPAASGHTRA